MKRAAHGPRRTNCRSLHLAVRLSFETNGIANRGALSERIMRPRAQHADGTHKLRAGLHRQASRRALGVFTPSPVRRRFNIALRSSTSRNEPKFLQCIEI
jgi:hypothetical protein